MGETDRVGDDARGRWVCQLCTRIGYGGRHGYEHHYLRRHYAALEAERR